MIGLTEGELEVYSFLLKAIKNTGYPPTLEEIGKGISLSKSVVHRRLKALEDKRYIKRLKNIPRAITILPLESG